MGLDNGIIMILKTEAAREAYTDFAERCDMEVNSFFSTPFVEAAMPISADAPYEVEICYWRKFWGFRNDCEYFHDNDKYFLSEEYEIEDIIDTLSRFMYEPNWEESEGNQVWGYFEYLPVVAESLVNLHKLRALVSYFEKTDLIMSTSADEAEDADVVIYTYDSY